jgi:hypothetical protein
MTLVFEEPKTTSEWVSHVHTSVAEASREGKEEARIGEAGVIPQQVAKAGRHAV